MHDGDDADRQRGRGDVLGDAVRGRQQQRAHAARRGRG